METRLGGAKYDEVRSARASSAVAVENESRAKREKSLEKAEKKGPEIFRYRNLWLLTSLGNSAFTAYGVLVAVGCQIFAAVKCYLQQVGGDVIACSDGQVEFWKEWSSNFSHKAELQIIRSRPGHLPKALRNSDSSTAC